MASIKPTSVPTKRLSSSINAASSTFTLNDIEGWDGVDLSSSDFGTKAYGVFRDTTNTILEIFEFDPSTIASGSITILRRGLKFTGDLTTEVTANKLTWVRNETLVELGSDVPQLLAHYIDDLATQTISGIKTFDETTMPRISAQHTYVAGEEERLATKRYVDSVALSGAPDASTSAKGVAEEATLAETEAKTAAGSAARLFLNPSQLRAANINDYVVAGGTTNAFTLTPSPAITSYVAGQVFVFQSISTNSSAVTVNVSGLGAKNLNKGTGSTPLVTGDIVGNRIYIIAYDGTQFQVIGGVEPILAGTIQMYVGSSAPQGWNLCDGSALSRTATNTANLFAVISTTYGVGDGSTTYNVPDFRGRVPVGVGTGTGGGSSGTGAPTGGSALTAVSRATWKGEETHTLVTAEMPAHTHTYSSAVGGSTGGQPGGSLATASSTDTGSTGGDGAHNNLQPVMGVNFIIKL